MRCCGFCFTCCLSLHPAGLSCQCERNERKQKKKKQTTKQQNKTTTTKQQNKKQNKTKKKKKEKKRREVGEQYNYTPKRDWLIRCSFSKFRLSGTETLALERSQITGTFLLPHPTHRHTHTDTHTHTHTHTHTYDGCSQKLGIDILAGRTVCEKRTVFSLALKDGMVGQCLRSCRSESQTWGSKQEKMRKPCLAFVLVLNCA